MVLSLRSSNTIHAAAELGPGIALINTGRLVQSALKPGGEPLGEGHGLAEEAVVRRGVFVAVRVPDVQMGAIGFIRLTPRPTRPSGFTCHPISATIGPSTACTRYRELNVADASLSH